MKCKTLTDAGQGLETLIGDPASYQESRME